MFSNSFKLPGGSFQTKRTRNKKISDRDSNTLERVNKKYKGAEQMASMRQTFTDLEAGTIPIGCVHSDGDGFIIALIELKWSEERSGHC